MAKSKRCLLAVCLAALVLLAPAGRPRAKEPSPEKPPEAAQEALSWEKDFDLILERKQAGVRESNEKGAALAALAEESERLEKEAADLKARRAQFDGNYTTETLITEMGAWDVTSLAQVRAAIDARLAAIETRLREIEARVKGLKRNSR